MDRLQKFLRRIDKKLLQRIDRALDAIRTGNGMEKLDMKPLQGKMNLYRCRIGNVRIIFYRDTSGIYTPVDADFRGNIYKK